MSTTNVTLARLPRVGERNADGLVWTGWNGWQRCCVAVPVVPAAELAEAETALADTDAELRQALALAAAWQQEAMRLRREVRLLRHGRIGRVEVVA